MVHDGFVEAGYLAPRPRAGGCTRRTSTPARSSSSPASTARPSGTCALVADGPFGLPSDRAFAEENDALRAELRGPMLRVRLAGRRRRPPPRTPAASSMRLFAAMTRVALDEFPDSPVLHRGDARERALLRRHRGRGRASPGRARCTARPAVLLHTGGARAGRPLRGARDAHPAGDGRADHRARPRRGSRTQRTGAAAARRTGSATLLDEQGVTGARSPRRSRLLAERHPHALRAHPRRGRGRDAPPRSAPGMRACPASQGVACPLPIPSA